MDKLYDIGSYAPNDSADVIKLRGRTRLQPNKEVKAMEFEVKDIVERHQLFKLLRGEILTNAITVEEKMEDIIRKLLFRKETEGSALFQSIVIGRDFFGFMQKCKILSDLLKTLPPFKKISYSDLIGKIHYVIDMRNKFAHARVNYEGLHADKVVIDYFKEKMRSEELTKESVEKFTKKCKECYKELDQILHEAHQIYGS